MIAPPRQADLTRQDVDAIAWKFLSSEFAGPDYRSWSIDRRLDAFLHHHQLTHIVEYHCAQQDLLDRAMANIGRATRTGLLARPNTRESIADRDCPARQRWHYR